MKNIPSSAEPAPWIYRSVAFDLDGLLIDTEPVFAEAVRQLLARRGREWDPAILRAMMGTPAGPALAFLREHYHLDEPVEDLVRERTGLFFEALERQPARLLPGAFELLDRLEQRRIPRAIATSSDSAYVQRVLAPFQMLHRFDFILTCEDVRHGKPAPEVYLKAAQRFGHAADQLVVFEDSVNGLRAARTAGARCVVVPHALVNADDYAEADVIVPRLDAPLLLHLMGLRTGE